MEQKYKGRGVLFAGGAEMLWGISPVYWKLLSSINSLQILGFRIILSLIVVSALLLVQRNVRWPRMLKHPRTRLYCLGASLMITANWGIYIWGVNAGHTVECSLGYYINPLLSILLGLIFFRERLLPLQWLAFGCAAAGVTLLTVLSGVFPWLSLFLALTFGMYGLLKKKIPSPSLETLGSETLLASPIAVLLLLNAGPGIAVFQEITVGTLIPLLLAGIITTVPLFFFAQGVKNLPLSAMGFLQFINPTLQLISGVCIFGEPFPAKNLLAFVFIWVSVLLYAASFTALQRNAIERHRL